MKRREEPRIGVAGKSGLIGEDGGGVGPAGKGYIKVGFFKGVRGWVSGCHYQRSKLINW